MLSLAQAIDILSAACCLFALWKGDGAERAAAAAVIGNVLLGQAGHYLASGLSDEIRVANDGLAALVLLGVTVRSGTPWMGVVMLFYAAQFSLHAYYLMMERSGGDYVHALINNLNFIGVNLCLVIGTLVAWRGRRVRARAAPATERRFIPR